MDEDTLLIFIDESEEPASSDVTRGLESAMQSAASRVSAVAVATVRDNLRSFLTGLDAVLNGAPKEVGGLTLDEVEIHAQIDGKGNIGLTGLAGTEIATQSGIKFVLRKKA